MPRPRTGFTGRRYGQLVAGQERRREVDWRPRAIELITTCDRPGGCDEAVTRLPLDSHRHVCARTLLLLLSRPEYLQSPVHLLHVFRLSCDARPQSPRGNR